MCKFVCPFQWSKGTFIDKEVSWQHFEKAGQTLAAPVYRNHNSFPVSCRVSLSPAHSSYRLAPRYHADGLIPGQSGFAKKGSCFSTLPPFSAQALLDHTNLPRSPESVVIMYFSIPRERERRRNQDRDAMRQKRFESLTAVYKLHGVDAADSRKYIYGKHHHQKMSSFKRKDDSIQPKSPKSLTEIPIKL